MEVTSKSTEETYKTAGDFLNTLHPQENGALVVGLSGDLGSGKTTFVKGVAGHLGLKQTVTSPTFVIEKIYKLENQSFDHLIHIDAYRLESGKELEALGWSDIARDPKNLILVEWPERVRDILPSDIKTISFAFVDEVTRTIKT